MLRSTLLVLAWAFTTGADAKSTAPAGLDERVWAITDAVLDHHLDPPTRQQMIFEGIWAVYGAAGVPTPDGLARRVSALTSPAQLAPLLDEAWSLPRRDKIEPSAPEMGQEDVLMRGMLGSVPGGARLLSAQEYKVEESLAGNHYVGLQIALGFNKEANRPEIATVLEGGPAERAGVQKEDLIEEIDGVGTEGLDVRAVVSKLRGAEGTSVVLRVRQPKSNEARVIKVTRGLLPRKTIRGIRNRLDGTVDFLIQGTDSIGYVKFDEITGSTPQELRRIASRLEEDGAKALVLDLREVSQANLHPAVLVADCLLESGTIGRVRMAGRVETFRAEPDALFRDLPLAVLVDRESSGMTAWLAAALQDNHRAIIAGLAADRRTGPPNNIATGRPRRLPIGATEVWTGVPIGDGTWVVEMATGRLERGDGRPLERPARRISQMPQQFVRLGQPNGKDEEEAAGRLVPDILVPALESSRSVRIPQSPTQTQGEPELDLNVRGDVVLTAALRRLREELKPR